MPASTISDTLIPEFDSPERKSTLVPATFNLTATIIGGGVLSLPLAFAKCGVMLGALLMVVAAVITERSLFLLCLTARITGATSYGEVGKAAFGDYMEYFISFLLFVFLIFVLVAYMVLVQDIWTSILHIVLSRFGNESQNEDSPGSVARTDDLVLLVILLIMSPFLFQRTLYALRFNCYIGFASVSCLCYAFCHHAFVVMTTEHVTTPSSEAKQSLLMWSTSFEDVLFAFPIVALSFLSIFNVLPIQAALIQPTRERTLLVIDGAMGISFFVMLLFGISGYMYAGDATDGNILNNNGQNFTDWIFLVGRLGCGITIMLAMAMVLLPCRESLLELLDVFFYGPHHIPLEDEEEMITHIVAEGEDITLLAQVPDPPSTYGTNEKEASKVNLTPKSTGAQRPSLLDNTAAHYLSTIGIATFCYLVAIRVPGVAVVWSFCGSFMAYMIAFILPTACYIKIQRDHPLVMQIHGETSKGWVWFSWALLVVAVVAAIACTIQTCMRILL